MTLVGHSLGAAIATLDAVYLKLALPASTTIKVINHGSPRIGNQAFANYIDAAGVSIGVSMPLDVRAYANVFARTSSPSSPVSPMLPTLSLLSLVDSSDMFTPRVRTTSRPTMQLGRRASVSGSLKAAAESRSDKFQFLAP